MKPARRHLLRLLGATLALGGSGLPGLARAEGGADDDEDDGLRAGKVFTSSNAAGGNELLVYAGAAGGLELVARAATGGHGSGAGLGSQGAVALAGDGRHV